MSDKKRKYTKRSDYWEKFKKQDQPLENIMHSSEASSPYEPQLIGESFYNYESKAYSRNTLTSDVTSARRNNAAIGPKIFKYTNIRAGMLPYEYGIDGVNVRDAIELCQKAYCNVSIFRNAIDMMADFSNSNLYLEGGSAKSRDFIEAWFKKIKIWRLKDQYFREFYRSGNVFLYTLESKFNVEDFAKVRNFGLSLKTNNLPVKYILLNPYDMVAKRSTSFEMGLYEKILSEYELERLQNPKTEEDKEIYDALTPEMKTKLKKNGYYDDGMKVKLDPDLAWHCARVLLYLIHLEQLMLIFGVKFKLF